MFSVEQIIPVYCCLIFSSIDLNSDCIVYVCLFFLLRYICIEKTLGFFPVVRLEEPSLMIMKTISTNNSNYTSPLLKCDKADNVAFIEFIMLTGTTCFSFISLRYGLSERAKTDNYGECCYSLFVTLRCAVRRVCVCVCVHAYA